MVSFAASVRSAFFNPSPGQSVRGMLCEVVFGDKRIGHGRLDP